MSAKDPISEAVANPVPTVPPKDVYGRPILVLSVISIFLAVILITFAAAIGLDPLWRSIAVGVGLVTLSTGLTVFVSALMYRVAPAATAPALAMLYLLKVVVMGWYVLSVGAPEWLHSSGFAITVAAGLILSWLVLAPVAMRASNVLASDYAAVVRAKEAREVAEAENQAATILEEEPSKQTEGGVDDRA